MTAQPPSAQPSGAPRRPGQTSARRRNLAVSTAAIPAVLLSSVALAEPAAAHQVTAPSVRAQAPAVPASPTRVVIPAAEVASRVPALKVPAVSSPASYTVKPGDTMSAIASRHGKDLSALLKLNGMNLTTVIYPGQKLRLSGGSAPAPVRAATPQGPAPAAGSYIVKSGDTLGAIASRHGITLNSLLAANKLSMTSVIYPGQKLAINGKATAAPVQPSRPQAPAPAAGSYIVKSGDTLGAIASRHGITLNSLLAANKLSMTSVIYPGQKLAINGKATGAPAPAPTNLVPSTFLGVTYPQAVVADANRNKQILNSLPAPTTAEMRTIVANTARSMGVDPSLALAFSFQESGFNQRAVSPANAIGAMQVIPMSGQWASDLVGRKLNLLNPQDNATAGVAIIRSLLQTSPSQDIAIASYYQGQYSVKTYGMFSDTKNYVAAIKAHQKNFR